MRNSELLSAAKGLLQHHRIARPPVMTDTLELRIDALKAAIKHAEHPANKRQDKVMAKARLEVKTHVDCLRAAIDELEASSNMDENAPAIKLHKDSIRLLLILASNV